MKGAVVSPSTRVPHHHMCVCVCVMVSSKNRDDNNSFSGTFF